MTFVSKLALAAALTLGTSALGTAPALAQKADKNQAAGPQLKVSDAFRTPAAAAEAALKLKDIATADAQLTAAEAVAANDDEKYYSAFLRLQIELERKNEAGQIKALGILASNPKTPADRVNVYGGLYNYMLGSQLVAQKKPADAIPVLLKARQLGTNQPDLPVLLANAYAATGKSGEAIAEVNRAIEASKAAGRKPPVDWYKFVIPRVNATGDRAAMADWLKRFIAEYPTAQNWRWAIQVYRTPTDTKTQKINLYRLMRATNALADRADYADYAYAAQQSGLPWEAVAAIDEGRKAGKIPAGDADAQRIYAASQTAVKAEGSLDGLAKQAGAGANGKAAQQTADAFLASGNYAKALELYDLALQKGSVDTDEVNLNRGVALRALGRKDEARTAFQAVKGTHANLALLWQTSIDSPPLA
ncbi:tetratricopeptide (TPR) repeat protein [Sphingomonas naasensis]|uniref:Tetratricopeptide repeat protein n=1 Tax=Sphingomonas naasensis TaxID=1344951 RepID=A0A4S1WUJ0_9SPHN|nr:tetratricopeptide repeat protein [Sphingomonas naasensis]NIJ18636.1 tetratricopeptide (TPR) repeat protein [Sphingomonas naasensis]TGX45880.1 tetratricopeptide repeat protein [Sphingomonas naasensis]